MEARWLLGYLLSKPDNWTVVVGDIVKRGNCGRDKARKMIAELVQHGYAEREQTRDDGKFGASVLVIFDEPRAGKACDSHAENAGVAFLPQTDLPATAKPSPDSPAPVKSAHSNNLEIVNTDHTKEREARERGDGKQEDNPAADAAPDMASLVKRVKAMEMGAKPRYSGEAWKGAQGSSTLWAAQRFAELSPAEREQAERLRDAYLAECARQGVKPVAIGNYFRDRKFEGIKPATADAAPRVSGGRIAVPVMGPVWAIAAFLPTLGKPAPIDLAHDHRETVLRTYETLARTSGIKARAYLEKKGCEILDDGQVVFPETFERDELRRLVMDKGFPETRRLYDAIRDRGHVTVDARLEALKGLMEAVPVGSATFEAWRAFYAERFIPFLPEGWSMPVAYFPRGGPEALDDFLDQVKTVMSEASDDAA